MLVLYSAGARSPSHYAAASTHDHSKIDKSEGLTIVRVEWSQICLRYTYINRR